MTTATQIKPQEGVAGTAKWVDVPAVIVAGVGVSAMGALFYNLLPLVLGAAQDYRGLDDRQIGLLSTAYFLGFTLTAALGYFWIRRFSWRRVSLIATPIAIAAFLLATQVSGYVLLLICVALAGAALSMLYGIGTTALGDTTDPARWFGVKVAAEAATGAVLLLLLPDAVVGRWGFDGLLVALAASLLILAPVVLLLPRQGRSDEADAGNKSDVAQTSAVPVWSALLGCLLFMAGETAIWAFVERIGNSAGFDAGAVGTLLAVTLVFALSGSLTAAWIGGRFAMARPISVACLCFFVALVLLVNANEFVSYAAGSCLVMFSVGFGLAFAVSTVATLDRDGRYVVLTVPAIGIGIMIGPAIAGFLTAGNSFTPVLVFCGLSVALALVAFLFSVGRGSIDIPVTPV